MTFQTHGITYKDNQIRVRIFYKISGNFFFLGAGSQRVAARQINKGAGLISQSAYYFCQIHVFSRPVSLVLVHTCKCIKDVAFSHIVISGKRNRKGSVFSFFQEGYHLQFTIFSKGFYKDKSGVFISDCQNTASDFVGMGIVENARIDTLYRGFLAEAQIQKPL